MRDQPLENFPRTLAPLTWLDMWIRGLIKPNLSISLQQKTTVKLTAYDVYNLNVRETVMVIYKMEIHTLQISLRSNTVTQVILWFIIFIISYGFSSIHFSNKFTSNPSLPSHGAKKKKGVMIAYVPNIKTSNTDTPKMQVTKERTRIKSEQKRCKQVAQQRKYEFQYACANRHCKVAPKDCE